MSGELENLPKPKKYFNIVETICCRAAKYFCSLWATQNLSRSPSLMLRLLYLHRFTSFGVILLEKNHAAVAFAPFLLILLKSGPTDDETFLPFSGSLWKRFLIFKAEKNVRSFAFRGAHRSAYRISRNENKRHDHFQKMSSTYHIVCNTGGWGEAAPGCETSAAVAGRIFSHSGLTPAVAKYNQHVGLFRLFSEAAWWRSSCLIHRWP